jgi:hypothetical protein
MSASRRMLAAPIRSPTWIRPDRLDLLTVITDVKGSDDAASAGVMPTSSTRRFGRHNRTGPDELLISALRSLTRTSLIRRSFGEEIAFNWKFHPMRRQNWRR